MRVEKPAVVCSQLAAVDLERVTDKNARVEFGRFKPARAKHLRQEAAGFRRRRIRLQAGKGAHREKSARVTTRLRPPAIRPDAPSPARRRSRPAPRLRSPAAACR